MDGYYFQFLKTEFNDKHIFVSLSFITANINKTSFILCLESELKLDQTDHKYTTSFSSQSEL